MPYIKRKNNAKSTITDNPLTAGATTVNVQTGQGARFPTSGNFIVTIWDKITYSDPFDDSNMEICIATARTDDAIVIIRGQESTSGVSHPQNSAIEMLITSGSFNDLSGATPVVGEIPTGNIDDNNVTFTLANTPTSSNIVKLFLNGQRLTPTVDYSVTSNTITMVSAPFTDSVLLVDYYY